MTQMHYDLTGDSLEGLASVIWISQSIYFKLFGHGVDRKVFVLVFYC